MKTKQVERKGTYLRAFRAAFTGAHRLSVYRDGVRSDDTGKRLQLLVGDAHESGDLCGQRTVSCSQLFRAGRQPPQCDFHGIYGEYPPYFLWTVTAGTIF